MRVTRLRVAGGGGAGPRERAMVARVARLGLGEGRVESPRAVRRLALRHLPAEGESRVGRERRRARAKQCEGPTYPPTRRAYCTFTGHAAGTNVRCMPPMQVCFSFASAVPVSHPCRQAPGAVAGSACTLATSIRRFCVHAVPRTCVCCIRSRPVSGDPGRARARGETLRADVQRLGGKEPCRLRVCGAPSRATCMPRPPRTSLTRVCPRRPRLPSPPQPRRRCTLAAAVAAITASA